MNFVDEALISVSGGKGGNGCLSFLRKKFVPRGGPDGGDGGDGGSVYFYAESQCNTLIEFSPKRIFKAECGGAGSGSLKKGRLGKSLFIRVPLGTSIYDEETKEMLGDLTRHGDSICVAKGGMHGIGNARYKSSTNQSPRQTTQGKEGEVRSLVLRLKLLADVGVLGLPNAGKSTLVSAISNAKTKIASYPFTTLNPILGVVRVSKAKSFVVADIPGIIQGASSGTGLGVNFLKHISRCSLILHVIDVNLDTVSAFFDVSREIIKFGGNLLKKERWIVFNKVDLIPTDSIENHKKQFIEKTGWNGPIFYLSASSKIGINQLCNDITKRVTQ